MSKVRATLMAVETVHNQDLGGVKVTIQLHNQQQGEKVFISLPFSCAWRGRLIQVEQHYFTDETGRVVVMLPPSDELVPLQTRTRAPGSVLYKLFCKPIGAIAFEVPNVAEWTLGE